MRMRVEMVLAVIFGLLAVVTSVWPTWMEAITGLEPDAGSGAAEWGIVVVFAVVALLLAAIGLFGVMAYLVSQRTREIGVRLALGASRFEVFRLIIGRGVALAAGGALLGVGGAMWLTWLMENLLFAISPNDPLTFVAVPLLLMAVALLACYIPARRAMQTDPVTALRAD